MHAHEMYCIMNGKCSGNTEIIIRILSLNHNFTNAVKKLSKTVTFQFIFHVSCVSMHRLVVPITEELNRAKGWTQYTLGGPLPIDFLLM